MSSTIKTVTIPHNYTPRDYQLDFLSSDKRFKVFVVHRRGGKSKTALNDQIAKALKKKGIYYYFLPTYRQAKQVIWDALINEHVPQEVIDRKNESELAIYYKNGSIQRFVGCEDIDKHRGVSPIDVVFDEFSEMNEEIWTAIIQPVLRENGGSATFIFTPKGKNHSWRLLEQARQDPKNWYWSIKTVYDTNGLDAEEIEQAKKETPEALFRQEYLCSFEDGAGQFFRRIHDNKYKIGIELPEQGTFQIGVDLAKYNDYTVITPFNMNTFYAYPQDRFNQVDWNLQKARIEVAARKYSNALIRIDSTGIGDPVVEDLQARGLNFDDDSSFKFTEQSRKNLLNNLAILLEQGKIKIPDDQELITELEGFQFDNSSGRLKIVSTTTHDDRVMSLALAVWKVQEPINETYEEFSLYKSDFA